MPWLSGRETLLLDEFFPLPNSYIFILTPWGQIHPPPLVHLKSQCTLITKKWCSSMLDETSIFNHKLRLRPWLLWLMVDPVPSFILKLGGPDSTNSGSVHGNSVARPFYDLSSNFSRIGQLLPILGAPPWPLFLVPQSAPKWWFLVCHSSERILRIFLFAPLNFSYPKIPWKVVFRNFS